MADVMCPACLGDGEWEAECCNGAGGCSCRGQRIPMGVCNVCGGSGYVEKGADTMATIRAIEGYGFIGTGPGPGTVFDSLPRMGRGYGDD